MRPTLRLRGTLQSAPDILIEFFADPWIGAAWNVQLARGTAIDDPVGTILPLLDQALLTITALTLLQSNATKFALFAAECAVAVTPVA